MTTATAGRNYIFNRETLKIELHFEKEEYQALPEATRKEIKSNFLFSGKTNAWVSRAKEPNLYHAKQVAKKLGFTEEVKQGDRLTFAEQVERQTERAEARAERFEGYAHNAERRAEGLQAEFNSYRGDIAFFTQPIIAGHSGSHAFARRRQRIYDRYDKGFEEYRKSEYFRDRAATAQNTADMKKFKDPVYLDNRIKECKKTIRSLEKNIIHYEEVLYNIENGTPEKNDSFYKSYTAEQVTEWIENTLERIEAEMDKQAYMENCLDEIGGNKFSKDNIKPGYIVKVKYSDRCEILTTGPVNITYRILSGGAAGMVLTAPYAAIKEIIEAKEPVKEKIINPFKEGDILCKHRPADDSIYRAFQVVKTTATGVKIRPIEVKEGKPLAGQFTSDKVEQKKITKSKYSDFVGVYHDDWQLHKYTGV
jgi:hypothetical protein